MNIEEFKKEIQFWTNLQLIRYSQPTKEEEEAISNEIGYRLGRNRIKEQE